MINDFASYTNGILQAACDRLRTESDEEHRRIPQIDASQTHDDLRIDCAGLRVSKRVISDRFVSSRANVCITASNRKQQACLPYFFEFVVAEHLGSLMDDDDEEEEEEDEQKERSVLCVGLSTEHMPLNACVGSVQKTVGYHSQGTCVHSSAKRENITCITQEFERGIREFLSLYQSLSHAYRNTFSNTLERRYCFDQRKSLPSQKRCLWW